MSKEVIKALPNGQWVIKKSEKCFLCNTRPCSCKTTKKAEEQRDQNKQRSSPMMGDLT